MSYTARVLSFALICIAIFAIGMFFKEAKLPFISVLSMILYFSYQSLFKKREEKEKEKNDLTKLNKK